MELTSAPTPARCLPHSLPEILPFGRTRWSTKSFTMNKSTNTAILGASQHIIVSIELDPPGLNEGQNGVDEKTAKAAAQEIWRRHEIRIEDGDILMVRMPEARLQPRAFESTSHGSVEQ